jgi:hypothetical protein
MAENMDELEGPPGFFSNSPDRFSERVNLDSIIPKTLFPFQLENQVIEPRCSWNWLGLWEGKDLL